MDDNSHIIHVTNATSALNANSAKGTNADAYFIPRYMPKKK
jgi:hypothetical protein